MDVPVKDVLITGGEEEVLIDEIREFVLRSRYVSLPGCHY
jgi:hypothetical protein